MTCASCAARVEKKLNRVEGVSATVNYATEKAKVAYPSTVSIEQLIETVEATGYTARRPQPADPQTPAGIADDSDTHARELRQRLLISAMLAAPVLLLSMIPALQFDNWQWLALTLASPVVVWGALPFHRAAFTNVRHRATTMATLIRWACWPPTCGRCGRCSPATPDGLACG